MAAARKSSRYGHRDAGQRCGQRRNAGGSPSKRKTFANRLPQSETALRTIISNTGCTSVGEALITRRISDVAACCSSASSRSRIALPSCSWRSALDTCAVGALRALGPLVRCPLVGCPLLPCRCMSLPYGGFTTMLNAAFQ